MPEAHPLRMQAFQKYRAWILEPSGHMLHWISWNIVCFLWGDHFLDVARCLAMKSYEDDQQCFEFDPVFDWKPVKRNECRSYAIIFSQIEN